MDESPVKEDERFSFARFAGHPFFKQVNAWLVSHSQIDADSAVVDLACGPGAVTELILGELDETLPGPASYRLDPPLPAPELPRHRSRSRIVHSVRGTPERLATPVPPVDAAGLPIALLLIP